MSRTLTTACALVLATGCADRASPVVRPDPDAIVEHVDDCIWFDETGRPRNGPSPLVDARIRRCERATDRLTWRGCVHLDLDRVACINGCSECLAHVVGDDAPMPSASRADRCWDGPDRGCAVAFDVGNGGKSSHGMARLDAPDYDCVFVQGACTAVPWTPHGREE